MAGFPVPIGTTAIRSVSRRIIREEATDVYYLASPLSQRLFAQNRVVRRGGFQIESRFIFTQWANGGSFYGPQVLNVTPSTNETSGAWTYKTYYAAVTLTQRTLIKADSPIAVANYIVEQCELAKLALRTYIYSGIWSNGTNPDTINGMYQIVDTGAVSANYAGLTRAAYPFLKSQVTTAVTTLSMSALQSLFALCTKGARAPTLIVSTRANMTRYFNLVATKENFWTNVTTVDQNWANGGFVGSTFNGQPWFVDEKITPTGTQGNLFMLNEPYFELIVNENGDFTVKDFQQAVNQMTMTMLIYVALNLICTNPQLQGKFTGLLH